MGAGSSCECRNTPFLHVEDHAGSNNTRVASRYTREYALILPFPTLLRACWGSDSNAQHAVHPEAILEPKLAFFCPHFWSIIESCVTFSPCC